MVLASGNTPFLDLKKKQIQQLSIAEKHYFVNHSDYLINSELAEHTHTCWKNQLDHNKRHESTIKTLG